MVQGLWAAGLCGPWGPGFRESVGQERGGGQGKVRVLGVKEGERGVHLDLEGKYTDRSHGGVRACRDSLWKLARFAALVLTQRGQSQGLRHRNYLLSTYYAPGASQVSGR